MISKLYRHSPCDRPPLRVGVMLDGTSTLQVCAAVLEDIAASNFARLELVIMNVEELDRTPPVTRSKAGRIANRLRNKQLREGMLFDFYCKWDQKNAIDPDPLALRTSPASSTVLTALM